MNKTELVVVLSFISVAGWALEQSVNVSHVGGTAASVNGDGGVNVHLTNGGAGGTASNFGALFPGAGTAAGGIGANGNMQAFAADASSAMKVNVVAGGAGGGAAQFTGATGALTTPGYNGVPVSSFPVNMLVAGQQITTSNPVPVQSTGTSPVAVLLSGSQISNTNPLPVNQQGVWGATVTFPSPQAVTQSGTWTMQPGNTPNTAPWLVVGSTLMVHDGSDVQRTVGYSAGQSSVPANALIGGAAISNSNPMPVNQQGVWGATVTFPSPQAVTQSGGPWSTYTTNAFSSTTVTNVVGPVPVTPSTGVYTTVSATAVPTGLGQNAYGNNGAAIPQGTSVAQINLSSSGLHGVWSGPDYTFASYSASSGVYTVANTTGDIAQLCGNQNNVTLVTGLRITFTQTTAGIIPVTIAKRSAQDAGVYFSTMTDTAEDTNYPPSQSTATFFNNGITNAALVGYIDQQQVGAMASATATPNDIYISPANWRMKPIVLRSHDQCLAVNLQSTSFTGGKATITWEWMEVKGP